MPFAPALRFPLIDPLPLPCILNVPVPRSRRLPMPANAPERLVTEPAFAPFSVHVALVARSVPMLRSVRFSIDVQLTAPLLPALEPVMVYVWPAPVTVSLPALPFTDVMPLQAAMPVLAPPFRLNVAGVA